MKTRILPLVMLVWFGAACAPAGPAAPRPQPPTVARLAYTASAPAVLLYDVIDSTTTQLQAGPAGSVNILLASQGTAELRVEPDSAGEKVTVGYREFSGSYSNSAGGGTVEATAADIKTPAVLRITSTGRIEFIRKPELTKRFVQVASSEGPFRRFFVPLPGSPVRPGTSWEDTIQTAESADGVNTTTTSIITTTYVRDTVIAGRTMNYATYTAVRTMNASGTVQGVEMSQKLNGTAEGSFVWDPTLNAVYGRDESVKMSGGFDLPALGLTGMPITAHGRVKVQFKPND